MPSLKAQVRNGHLVLDVPTDLPEGTVLELVPADEEGGLTEEERAALRAELKAAYAEYKAGGETISAEELIAELRNLK